MVSAFLVGGDNLNELNFRELLRSKEEKRKRRATQERRREKTERGG